MAAQFVWFDLPAANAEVTAGFYAKLFGWTTAPADGAEPYRTWLIDGDQPWAGILPAGDATDPTAGRWVPYVRVDDLDAATDSATALGATVVRERTEGPAGASVVIADPGGAPVALFVPRT